MHKMMAQLAHGIECHGHDKPRSQGLKGGPHGRSLWNRFSVVDQPAVPGKDRLFLTESIGQSSENDGHDIAQHGGRGNPGKHNSRVHARRLGIHGRQRDSSGSHAAAGHGNGNVEDTLHKAQSAGHAEQAYDGDSHCDGDQRRRKDLHGRPDQKIPVDIEKASGDQGRDVEDQKVLLIDEAIHQEYGLRRKYAGGGENSAAQDTDHRPAQVSADHRNRLSCIV